MSNESPPPLTPPESAPPGLPAASPQPAAQVPAVYVPNQDERTMAMLTHLLGILTGFVGPLILWLVKKDQSPFLDHHGKQSLNFQFTLLVVEIGLMVVGGIATVVTWGLGLFILIPLMIAIVVYALVIEIQCCIRANEGQWCIYPVSIRFFP